MKKVNKKRKLVIHQIIKYVLFLVLFIGVIIAYNLLSKVVAEDISPEAKIISLGAIIIIIIISIIFDALSFKDILAILKIDHLGKK